MFKLSQQVQRQSTFRILAYFCVHCMQYNFKRSPSVCYQDCKAKFYTYSKLGALASQLTEVEVKEGLHKHKR